MTKQELEKKIKRIKAAIEKTNSDYLKNDYMKYLKKLERRKRNAV